MSDKEVTKEQLYKELAAMRERIVELEASEGGSKQAEVALRESEEKFRSISTSALDAVILIDDDGNVVYWNPAAERIFGYTSDEMTGQSVHEILMSERYRAQFEKGFKTFKKTGHGDAIGKVIELTAMRKGGDEFPIEIAVSPIRLKEHYWASGIIRDITDRKQAEEALRESEERYRIVFERAGDYVLMLDVEQGEIPIIMDANEAALLIHGYSRGEIIGKPITFLDQEMTPEMLLERKQLIDAKGGAVISAHHTRKDGTGFDVEANIQLVQIGEKMVLLSIERNITDRKQAEEEILRQAAVLQAINDVFRGALACKTEEELGKTCLAIAEKLTDSAFGYIAELNPAGLVDTIAISNPGWDECKMAVFDARERIKNMPIRGIDRSMIREGKSRIVNKDEMAVHPDRVGVPEGHPEITSFLGVPLKHEGETIGMFGLGNKEGGYDLADQEAVENLSVAIVEALRHMRAEETIKRRLKFDETIAEISSRFVGIYDIDNVIDASLADISGLSGASRAYLFLFNEQESTMDNTHEWCAEGVSPQMDNLKDLPVDMFPWWIKKLRDGETIHIIDVSKMPAEAKAEKEILEAQDIKSLLVLPVNVGEELAGFIGFDNVMETGGWTDDDLAILRISSEIIGNAFERKWAEDALRESEERLSGIIESIPDFMSIIDEDYNIVWANEIAMNSFGTDITEKKCYEAYHRVDKPCEHCIIREVIADGKVHSHEAKTVDKDGNTIYQLSIGSVASRYPDGRPKTVIEVSRDITERKQAEEALRESEEIFRNVIEQSGDAIYVLFEDKFDLINTRFTEIFGVTSEETKLHDFNLLDLVAPESRSEIIERSKMRERGETPSSRYEFVAFDKDHNLIKVEASVAEISYRGGKAVLGVIRDVTDRKRLEEQFHQAQKMESVGRLAGGVAHDFNNLLTIITGHADLAAMSLDSRDPTKSDLEEIQNAADRASDLTRQLLAFSRKQKLQPKVLNLNEIIAHLNKMLRRMIGEDIEILMIPDQELWHVLIDPSQIEQVIINLAVNARDAMPDGGKLTIGTQNTEVDEDYSEIYCKIPAGNYILLTVTDTGEGMSGTLKNQIFEPFFTTKAEGKGTGLGLSTVFGIVLQSGGGIEVQSELGEGTAFRIFLPQAGEDAKEIMFEGDTIDMPRGTETILVAEDEDALRSLVCRILKGQGYKLIDVQNGGEALMICSELDKPVDLVVTDVVMPSMSGDILVKNLREIWPGVKALYMSGYTADSVSYSKILESDEPFLQKPFRPLDLAWKVRRVLDSK